MRELSDQMAHFLAALIILVPIALMPHPASFAWAGFAIGFVRELTEEGNPATWAKARTAFRYSKLDICFWTIGGLFVGVFFGVS